MNGLQRREAAVAIAIARTAPHRVVFVQRATHLRHHAGQIGLPGGTRDAEDANLEATALRELHEEVGIPASDVRVVGRLEMVHSRVTPYDITPFVATYRERPLVVDTRELAGAFTVPLEVILRDLRDGEVRVGVARVRTPVLESEGQRIWGLTAIILRSFLDRWSADEAFREAVLSALREDAEDARAN